MRQIHLHNVFHRLGALFIVLTLGLAAALLAACSPAAPAAATTPAAVKPIPITGATATPMPTATAASPSATPSSIPKRYAGAGCGDHPTPGSRRSNGYARQ